MANKTEIRFIIDWALRNEENLLQSDESYAPAPSRSTRHIIPPATMVE